MTFWARDFSYGSIMHNKTEVEPYPLQESILSTQGGLHCQECVYTSCRRRASGSNYIWPKLLIELSKVYHLRTPNDLSMAQYDTIRSPSKKSYKRGPIKESTLYTPLQKGLLS